MVGIRPPRTDKCHYPLFYDKPDVIKCSCKYARGVWYVTYVLKILNSNEKAVAWIQCYWNTNQMFLGCCKQAIASSF